MTICTMTFETGELMVFIEEVKTITQYCSTKSKKDDYTTQLWNIEEIISKFNGENSFLLKLEKRTKLKVLLEMTADFLHCHYVIT